jgi:hypothetical protein
MFQAFRWSEVCGVRGWHTSAIVAEPKIFAAETTEPSGTSGNVEDINTGLYQFKQWQE